MSSEHNEAPGTKRAITATPQCNEGLKAANTPRTIRPLRPRAYGEDRRRHTEESANATVVRISTVQPVLGSEPVGVRTV